MCRPGDTFEPFEISPGVVLPVGEYRFMPKRIFFTSAQKRRLQGSIGLRFGNYWSGDFVARIYSSQVSYAVSPFLSFSNLVQFDNRSGNLGLQSRVHWTIEPGNEVFFVFGQG